MAYHYLGSKIRYRFVRGISASILFFSFALLFAQPLLANDGTSNKKPIKTQYLRLQELITLCLSNDPKILAGKESVKQARADALTASMIPNPSLSVEGGLLPLSRRYTVDEPGGPPEFAAGIRFSIDWLLFGKRSAAKASADSGISMAEAEFADLVRRRITELTQAYFNVLEAEALWVVATEGLKDMEHVESATQKAVANGGRPVVDLNRVKLELLNARRDERSAKTAVILTRATLRVFLGKAGETLSLDLEETLNHPITVEPLHSEPAYALAIQNRPDIFALKKKVSKAEQEVVLEGRNAFPEISPMFGISHQFQKSIGAPDVTAWNIGLEMSLPLFNRNQGNRAKAKAIVTQNGYELQAALSELRTEVEQAVQSLHDAKQNASTIAGAELKVASEVREAIKKAYMIGGRSLLELLDAHRNYRDVYRNYITSRADYWRSLFRYHSAIGKR